MTSFTLGEIVLPDAEQVLLREYYWWGQWREKEPVDPPWEEASPHLRRSVALRGYSMYDGLPIYPGDLIGPEECFASIGMNSFVALPDVIRLVARSEEVRPFLAAIPRDRPLASATPEEIQALAHLIDCLDSSHQIGPAKVTKILHKKRPAFVPILDSVVVQCLRDHSWPGRRRWPTSLELLTVIQQLLVETSQAFGPIQASLRDWGIEITEVRLLDFLLWTWQARHPDLPS